MRRGEQLTLKEIIDIISEIYKQHGIIDVEMNIEDGDIYELYENDEIVVRELDDGSKRIEIGFNR